MSTLAQPPAVRRAGGGELGPQQRIAALRAGLLGGRGPGASPAELEAHQRQRVDFGGQPVTVAREHLALVTDRARQAPLDRPRAASAARLAELGTGPPREHRPRRAGSAVTLVVGVLLGFAAAARRHRHAQR